MESDKMYALLERACCAYQRQISDPLAMAYLRRRGLNDETIRKFRVGYSPNGDFVQTELQKEFVLGELDEARLVLRHVLDGSPTPSYFDRMRNRIVLPFIDLSGRVVGFGGRIFPRASESGHIIRETTWESNRWCINPPASVFAEQDYFFGLDQAREAICRLGKLFAVEGHFDVMLAHQSGLENFIGLVGRIMDKKRISFLREKFPGVRIGTCYDGDEYGWKAADETLEAVKDEKDVEVYVVAVNGFDPANVIEAGGKLELNLMRRYPIR